jgi:hypothetical protein
MEFNIFMNFQLIMNKVLNSNLLFHLRFLEFL